MPMLGGRVVSVSDTQRKMLILTLKRWKVYDYYVGQIAVRPQTGYFNCDTAEKLPTNQPLISYDINLEIYDTADIYHIKQSICVDKVSTSTIIYNLG